MIRVVHLYKVKKYFNNVKDRNKAYYRLLSIMVEGDEPFSAGALNSKLDQSYQNTLEER